MLTASDIAKRLGLPLERVAYMYAKRILPEGVRVGGVVRFRENDIRKFERYLRARAKCRARGINPDSKAGPPPPIYSTAGTPRFDPRLVVANEQERKRQARSKTLAAGTKPIAAEKLPELPEPSQQRSKETK